MKKIIFGFVLVSIVSSPLTTFAADKQLTLYDKQIATLTKKIEALEKQLEVLLLKRSKREQELDSKGQLSRKAEATARGEILKLRSSDHVRGNPNAPVVIVVYSDFECPFCLAYHATMKRLLEEYDMDGKIAVVYRHFPLEQAHPNAKRIAEASECVAAQTGDKGFWKFVDTVFASRDRNSYTDMKGLDTYAVAAGANKTKFQQCVTSKAKTRIVSESRKEGESLGIAGTPHSFVVKDGEVVAEILGAQPYTDVVKVIDATLSELK